MADSQAHFRSVSLPSRLQPMNATTFEVELEKLKSWTMVPITTSEAVQSGLASLAELHISLQEFTQLQVTRQLGLHDQVVQERLYKQPIEGFVELLDSCNMIRELVQTVKENTRSFQLALRRKGLDSAVQHDIMSTYSCRTKKTINACRVKTLKTLKNSNGSNHARANQSGQDTCRMAFSEAAGVTAAVFKRILALFSGPEDKNGHGWKAVSRFLVRSDQDSDRSNDVVGDEMGSVELWLSVLQRNVGNGGGGARVLDLQSTTRRLQNLESQLQGMEAGLERLYRQLVRSRVALLNVVSRP